MSSLRKARDGKFSQREAAKKLGVSWRTLLRWEHPEFRPQQLSLETLEAMAILYGVTVDDLIGRTIPYQTPAV